MKQSKTINYPGPAHEALSKAAAYMTSKHQYEIMHSSNYSITFNKVRKFGVSQASGFTNAAHNETATLVANQVSENKTELNVGGSNLSARMDLKDAVVKIQNQRSEATSGERALLKTNIAMGKQLHIYSDHLEVRTGFHFDNVAESLDISEIGSVTLSGRTLTITDASGNLFVSAKPNRAKKAYEAVQSIRTVNA